MGGVNVLGKMCCKVELQWDTHVREAHGQLLVLNSKTEWACGGRLTWLNTCCLRL